MDSSTIHCQGRARLPYLAEIEGLASLPQRRFSNLPSFAQWRKKPTWPSGVARLSDLPPEIVLYVLKELNVSGLYAAIRSHRIFNDSWKFNTRLISAAVLSKSVECYPAAVKLDRTAVADLPAGFQAVVEQSKRILNAAECISVMYEIWLQDVVDFPGPTTCPGRLHYVKSLANRKAFKCAVYWIWRMVLTTQYKPFQLQKPLEKLPARATLSVCEILIWIRETAYTCLYGPISKMQRIYANLNPRPRLLQHRRMELCLRALLEDAEFDTNCRAAFKRILPRNDPNPHSGDALISLRTLFRVRRWQAGRDSEAVRASSK